MTSKKQLQIATRLALILLAVGVICYAAFQLKAPETPIRIMFASDRGKVFFDHKTHLSDGGHAISCNECHHHPEDTESDLRACGECHGKKNQQESVKQTCMECHEPDEFDIETIENRTDAFHNKCIGCHEEFGSGPNECSKCHVR